jgi:aminomethyltransferase
VSEPTSQPLRRTPLYDLHRRLGARLVPFAGYEMPLQYSGIVAEHEQARTRAAFFDVSHMGQAIVRGERAAAALESLVVGDIADLPAGRVRYTLLTNDRGGIIDDLMIVSGGTYFVLVVNASRKETDFARIADRMGNGAEMSVWDDRALLALQGPKAAHVMGGVAPPSRHMLFMSMENLKIGEVRCGVTRSGYTGEDGFEITVPATGAKALAALLLGDPEVRPAGLGARDTLRLEAGFCLYGNDLDESTTPVEAGLAWTIGRRRRRDGGFPGAGEILRQLAAGAARLRVGIVLDGRQPARAGARIVDNADRPLGIVTSGGWGPTVGRPIAMGYVTRDAARPGTPVRLDVRGKLLPATIVDLPFVPHRYAR